MKNFFCNISNKNYLNIFSRATTGIFSLLKILHQKNKYFIFPSTICPSPVYASIYSDTKIVFCDVNPKNGNLDIIHLENILKKNKNIYGIFAANMYGNPCNFDAIKNLSKKNSLFLIEDCAQSLGSKYKNKFTGSFGDASIYSFGYSKNIDLGHGGLVLSNDKNLSNEMEKLSNQTSYTKINHKKISLVYKKKYYTYCKNKNTKGFLDFININKFKSLFLLKKKNNFVPNLNKKIKKLNHIKEINNKKFDIYQNVLGNHLECMKIKNSVFPWRFNFFVNPIKRNKMLNYIWNNKGHANKLYPSIPKFLFKKKKIFNGSKIIEQQIINLPLDETLSLKDIQNNANLVLNAYKNT